MTAAVEIESDAMSLQKTSKFQDILLLLNTNIEGKRKSMFALTKIIGILLNKAANHTLIE